MLIFVLLGFLVLGVLVGVLLMSLLFVAKGQEGQV